MQFSQSINFCTPFQTGKLRPLRKVVLQPRCFASATTLAPAQQIAAHPAGTVGLQRQQLQLATSQSSISRVEEKHVENVSVEPLLAAVSTAVLTLAFAQPALAEAALPVLSLDPKLQEGFLSGFLLILFSEIGDKTFFIAMLLASRQSQTAVFAGTFGALVIMTLISVGLGQVLHEIDEILPSNAINLPIDDVLAAGLLVWFGVQTLRDAAGADEAAAEEKEEAREVVDGMSNDNSMGLILSTFALVFAAEWGDKSFLATIALSAASSPIGVVGGAIAGHGVATLMAVLGGSLLAKYFSERVLQYAGGSLFLAFAAVTIYDIMTKMQS